MRLSPSVSLWAIALFVATLAGGCGQRVSSEPQKPAVQAKTTAQATTTPSAKQPEAAAADTTKGLAELSADDRIAAEKQRVCPVSDELLGEHGKPYKATVKGQTVFLCCSACEKQLQADPDKYLAKLKTEKPKQP